jgi:hypothetical protein
LFLNNGNGTYRDVSELSGTAYNFQGHRQAGMGVDAADVNGDGRFDLFVTNFEKESNTLYENNGGGFFQDSSNRYNLTSSSLPWVGWGTMFVDFDMDTWLDLIVTNGHVDNNRYELGQEVPFAEPALLLKNLNGRRFELLGAQGGTYFEASHVGRALAVADLENDGDQDAIVGHQDGSPSLLENTIADASNGVSVQLIGTSGNRDAIGARLLAKSGDRVQQLQIKGGASYLSASDLRQVIALPKGADEMELEIRWLGGTISKRTVKRGERYMVWEPMTSDAEARWFAIP